MAEEQNRTKNSDRSVASNDPSPHSSRSTESPSEPHALVHAWLAARQDRNLDQLASLTAADAVWHSPVEGPQIGRSAVVNEVRRGYANTDTFESQLLHVHCYDETAATARIRNIATRAGKRLDSVQTLHIHVAADAVSAIRIEVDDPEAVEAFWS